jgi:hypothetical protein
MIEPGAAQASIKIPYFEGVNSLVSFNMSKNTEFFHAENARSKTIGTIEKREGQTVLGVNINGLPFVTSNNYGLFSFQGGAGQGFYRISVNQNPNMVINVSEDIFIADVKIVEKEGNPVSHILPLSIGVIDRIGVDERINNNEKETATIYYIDETDRWIPLSGSGTGITSGTFDYTYAEGCAFLVNQKANNRYVSTDGVTVIDSTVPTGHLFNTPKASRINFYKNRIYLADFMYNGIRYPTTILRSSYPLGLMGLLNEDKTLSTTVSGDVTTNGTTTLTGNGTTFTTTFRVGDVISVYGESNKTIDSITSDTQLIATQTFITTASNVPYSITGIEIEVTDTKYFYTNSGANTYDIYRGDIKVTVLTVIQINASSIVVTFSGSPALLSSDEIWISGTHDGQKIFRWINNPSSTGRDVQQYDSFKLTGGENDPITVLTNIGNVMFAANKNCMISWNDYTLENFDLDIGCVSKKGYVKMIGTMYFMHYTGVYSTSGGVPQVISNKVEKYITGATKEGKENCAAGKKGRSVFFTLGDVTLYKLDGSVNKILKDVCLEFNIVQQNWYVHTNIKASEFSTFIEDTDSSRLELADTSGNHAIKEFLCGETDDGEVIHFRVDTMKITVGMIQYARTISPTFEYSSKVIALMTEVERGSAMKLFVNLENEEEYYQVDGTITKGLSVIKITDKDSSRGKPPYCRLISLSIRDSSPQICKLNRMTLIVLPTTDENSNSNE